MGAHRLTHIAIIKTTVEIADALLDEAKRVAAERETTLRSLIQEGLRKVLEEEQPKKPLQTPGLQRGRQRPDSRVPECDLGTVPRRDLRRPRRMIAVDSNILV